MTETTERKSDAQVRTLVEDIARALVEDPQAVAVEVYDDEDETVVELRVPEQMIGKVIGKQGRTARAIRTVLSAVSDKLDRRYVLEIVE